MSIDSSESTSRTLLERVKQRDSDAWRRLVELYGPVVYRWTIQRGVQAADAADVAQEVFQAVATSIKRFRREKSGDSFRGWLWTVTCNKLRDHFRRQVGEPRGSGGSEAHDLLAQIPH